MGCRRCSVATLRSFPFLATLKASPVPDPCAYDLTACLKQREVDQTEGAHGQEERGIDTEVRVYEDQVYGFALRGDWNSKARQEGLWMSRASRASISTSTWHDATVWGILII